jgi:penicillin-binding protein 1A
MSQPNPPRSKTVLTNLTRVVQNLQERVHFSKLILRKDARVPELWIQEPGTEEAKVYPLLGDRYTIGRSSKTSDIVVRNPIVSQLHATLKRDPKHRRVFTLRDEQSTNGIFRNRRRVKTYELFHKDVLTLGPPDLEAAVRVQFMDPPPLPVKLLRYALYGISGLFGAASIGTAIAWQNIPVNPLPASQQGPVVVMARDQTPLVQVRLQGHIELKNLSDYSPHVIQALLASEDSRYYWHPGVDPLGIGRAVFTNVSGGSLQGGSTLTQQLARSLYRGYVGTEDSLGRKGREAMVALKLEAFYSKDFLLLNYLNKVYLGAYASGFEDASQFYFGKAAKNLSISEAATLVGILPAPNSFNPVQNYNAAIQYRDRVISRMAEQGRISNEEASQARRSRIEISPKAKAQLQSAIAPYYYSYVFDELEQLLGKDLAQEGNFIVETALDPRMQAKAESALSNTIDNEGSASGFSQGALVTMDFHKGEILAMVGGKDYRKSQFNRVTQALRQPGSTFKLFTYTTALEDGISPNESFSCDPVDWDGQLFSGCANGGSGSLSMSTGVMLSENPIALRVAQRVGLSRIIQTARSLGVKSTLKPVPGLVLGQSESTLLEMSRAYAVVANQGRQVPPMAIRKILDAGDCKSLQNLQTCRVIYDHQQDLQQGLQPLTPEVANGMTQLLTGVVRSGTGRAASLGLGEAGKTGTTNDNRDLWFIGFIPNQNLLTGIWLGNDDNKPTYGSSGQAAGLWGRFMRTIL